MFRSVPERGGPEQAFAAGVETMEMQVLNRAFFVLARHCVIQLRAWRAGPCCGGELTWARDTRPGVPL